MKILLPLLLLLPLLIQAQPVTVDGERLFVKKRPEPKLYKLPEVPKNVGIVTDTFPTYGITTSKSLDYYNGTLWYNGSYNETRKGSVETPINVMDTGLKIETVETRDTVYKCPLAYRIQYLNVDGKRESNTIDENCIVDKIVTTRRYKLYIINEYGQKEYLSMELTKQK